MVHYGYCVTEYTLQCVVHLITPVAVLLPPLLLLLPLLLSLSDVHMGTVQRYSYFTLACYCHAQTVPQVQGQHPTLMCPLSVQWQHPTLLCPLSVQWQHPTLTCPLSVQWQHPTSCTHSQYCGGTPLLYPHFVQWWHPTLLCPLSVQWQHPTVPTLYQQHKNACETFITFF